MGTSLSATCLGIEQRLIEVAAADLMHEMSHATVILSRIRDVARKAENQRQHAAACCYRFASPSNPARIGALCVRATMR
jgi:hypothetical protein